MVTNKNNTKLVSVGGSGAIFELGGISAPIVNPTRLPIAKIVKIVASGRPVYEHNPKKPSEKIRLTIANAREKNFVVEAPKAAPVQSTKPTAVTPTPAKVEPKKEEKKVETSAPAANTTSNADKATATTPTSDFTAKKG